VVDDLRRWLGDNRVGVAATIFQDPARHWGRRFVEGVTLVLQVMAVATLAMSVVLVLNTTSALITQQLDQIGVLKAIGARAWSVAWPYGVQVLAYGALALVLALPLGSLTAFGATQWFLNLFNIDYPTLRWSPWAIVWQVVAALIAPVLAAAWPIARGAAISVREAIATYGLSGDFGGTRFDRAVDRLAERFLPATYAAAVSNTFRRKQRLAFTVAVLVFGGVMFMVVMSLITSVNATIAADIERRAYDSRLGLQSVARIGAIESALEGAPDVQTHELWLGRGALVAHAGREVRDSAGLGAALVGLPVAGRLYRPNVIAGRWFTADDAGQNVVVLNAETAADNGLALGDTIDVDLGAPPAQSWRIIGLYRVVTGANFTTEEVYAPFPAVARAAAVPDGANIVLVRTGATVLDQARAASDRIETRLTEAGLPLEAFTTSIKLEERDFANNQFAPTVSMFLGLASLVATVGGIGLMSALVLGVLERRREIGVLRAIGARSPTLTALFVLEGMIMGLVSWVIAVPLSIVLAPALAEQLGLTMLELRLDYVFDWSAIWIWLAVVIVTGLVYSIGPARSAARVSVRESLAYS
jgi:putative ABC transport system permease protein